MKKNDYIDMLFQDNDTEPDAVKKELYTSVIDCAEIGLSQTPDSHDIDSKTGLLELWKIVQKVAKDSPAHCCSPFKAAELIAAKLGTKYERKSRRPVPAIINIEDFLD